MVFLLSFLFFQNGFPDTGLPIDYNKLYGDLCRKLLTTPVSEILPGTTVSNGASPTNTSANDVTSSAVTAGVPSTFSGSPTAEDSKMGFSFNPLSPASLAAFQSYGLYGGLYNHAGIFDVASMVGMTSPTSLLPKTPNANDVKKSMKTSPASRHSSGESGMANLEALAEQHVSCLGYLALYE